MLATGNTAVVVTSQERPLPAVTLGEVLATTDVPGGVVNLLTGDAAELGPVAGRARRRQRASTSPARRPRRADGAGALRGGHDQAGLRAPADGAGLDRRPGPRRMTPFLETKTVWHPIGL